MISVAMCTYNGEKFVEEQIGSIARQSVVPDELIVCDDGSSDGTVQLLEKLAQEVPFALRLHVNEKNLGYIKNFEKAISLCQGDIIFLCDQDDVWHVDKVKMTVEAFERYPNANLAFSNGALIDQDGNNLPSCMWEMVNFERPASADKAFEFDLFGRVVRALMITGAALAIRSKALPLAMPFSSSWYHDAWLAVLLSAPGTAIAIDENLISYRRHLSQQVGFMEPVKGWWSIGPAIKKGLRLYRINKTRNAAVKEASVTPPSEQAPPPVRKPDAEFSLDIFNEIEDRLRAADFQQFGSQERFDEVMKIIQEKKRHLNNRITIRNSLVRRPFMIAGSLLNRDYFAYSSGFSTACRDLMGI